MTFFDVFLCFFLFFVCLMKEKKCHFFVMILGGKNVDLLFVFIGFSET